MNTKARILIGACAAISVTLLTWAFSRTISPASPPDPVYQGKRISEWVRTWGHPSDPNRILAGLTNSHLPELVAHTVEALKTRDRPFRKVRIWLFTRSPRFVAKRIHPGPEAHSIRESAAGILATLGPAASNAVPTLCEAVLAEPDQQARLYMARAFRFIQPESNDAEATMLSVLKNDTSADIRASAAIFFRTVKSKSKDALAQLMKALEDPELVVRLHAARTLGEYGPQAKEAVGPLLKLVQTQDRNAADVRAALTALNAIAPDDATKSAHQ